MKFYEGSFLVSIVFIVSLLIAGVISARFLGHDNVVEETTEEVVKGYTGVDVDFTPSTPE